MNEGKPDGVLPKGPPIRLSLVVPAFNEQATLQAFAAEADRVLPTLGLVDYEIIMVDDGSTDSTWDVLERIEESVARVALARHDRNLGYGAALLTGIGIASMEFVAYTDADLQFDLGDLASLIRLIPTHDLVVGYRQCRADPVRRIIIARAYNQICNRVFDLPGIRDIDCSMKVFRRSMLVGVRLTPGGFGFDLELLVKCLKRGCRFSQVPVAHRARGGGRSKVGAGQILRTLKEMLCLAREGGLEGGP